MKSLLHTILAFSVMAVFSMTTWAGDSKDKSPSKSATSKAKADSTRAKTDQPIKQVDLLDAARQGLISVQAEGRGDGRMTVSITNRTSRQLRVVLPPGIIAQGATGQFGGMGGMGGGMGGMGGGMGGMGGGMGGMGGMMGGMGGGMGMMGGSGGMGMRGMGGMGRTSGTMPSMMGMMMLSRMIMYFCGDPDSWDMRSLMIGMMGMRGMGGGMGMMGGMGGMGGMMGGMGGGMRSVPATELPSATIDPGRTRNLPTRVVSLSPPDPQVGLALPQKGEPLQLGVVGETSNSPQVQKALHRLTAEMAPTSITQLAMWKLAAGLDWDTIAVLSQKWANRHELALAMDFVGHLDTLPAGETGQILFEVDGTDEPTAAIADQIKKAIRHQQVLGLLAEIGVPARPDRPSVACKVRLKGSDAFVQVSSSDARARNWIGLGKFTLPTSKNHETFNAVSFSVDLSEGILNRLVRAQLSKGVKDKGKTHYSIRIENASPLILNGLALVGTTSSPDETAKVLLGICVSPRRSLTVPASEEAVKELGLKKGIKLTALNLSGL
jgi:hypothetical protein